MWWEISCPGPQPSPSVPSTACPGHARPQPLLQTLQTWARALGLRSRAPGARPARRRAAPSAHVWARARTRVPAADPAGGPRARTPGRRASLCLAHTREHTLAPARTPSPLARMGLGWGRPRGVPTLLLTAVHRRRVGSPFPSRVAGRRGFPPQPPSLQPGGGQGGRSGGAGREPRGPGLPRSRARLGSRLRALGVVGAGAAQASVGVRAQRPRLGGSCSCQGRRPDRQRPRQIQPASAGPGSAAGTEAPRSVSRRTNPERGAGPGEGARGPIGHWDSGLDLVGQFLWQPGGRGRLEGDARRGDTHRRRLEEGDLALPQRGPLLEHGWEAAT